MTTTINASTSAGLISSADTSGILQLQTGNTAALTIDASQRVGVGTSSPSYKLDVNGVIATGSGSNRGFFYNDGSKILLESSSTYPIAVSVNGAVRATFDSAGNLGLGVTPLNAYTGSSFRTYEMAKANLFNFDLGSRPVAGLATNAYLDASANPKYIGTGYATKFESDQGKFAFYTAASGTAGNAISFTQAMTLDASGNLGVGTTSPTSKLGVNGVIQVTAAGNPSSGAGLEIGYGTVNASRTGLQSYNRTGSAWLGADYNALDHYFYTSGTERARIDSSGRFAIAVAGNAYSQDAGLTVNGTNFTRSIYSNINGTSTATHCSFANGNGVVGSITTSGSATTYNTSSDYRLKNITGALTGYKERLMSLLPKQGTWVVDGSEFRGFVAHDFANPYPKSVVGEKDAVDANGNPVMQGMQASSSEVMADLVALVQEQQAIIESLKARLDAANL